MPNHLDGSFDLECPECGHEFQQPLGWLQADPQFTWPECGQPFDAKELAAGLKEADEAIDQFLRDLSGELE